MSAERYDAAVHFIGWSANADAVSACESVSERLPHPSLTDDERAVTCVACLRSIIEAARRERETAHGTVNRLVSATTEERESLAARIVRRRRESADAFTGHGAGVADAIRRGDYSIAAEIGAAVAVKRKHHATEMESLRNDLAAALAALREIAWKCEACGAVATSRIVACGIYGTPRLASACDVHRGETYVEDKHTASFRAAGERA